MFKIAHSIGLLNRVVPVYDKTFKEIVQFMIYDDVQSLTIDIKEKSEKKEEEIIDNLNSNETFDLNKVDVKLLSSSQIENLSDLLDTEKIEIVLPRKGSSLNDNNENEVKGLINVDENNYNKIYFDIDKKGKIKKVISL